MKSEEMWMIVMSWLIGMLWIAIPEYSNLRSLCVFPFIFCVYFTAKYTGLLNKKHKKSLK